MEAIRGVSGMQLREEVFGPLLRERAGRWLRTRWATCDLAEGAAWMVTGLALTPLPWPCEQPASARWGGAQASRRPTQGTACQPPGPRCLEGHHTSGPQRVHLLGRGCQAGDDPRTPHSPDSGGTGGRAASALLLARLQAPRTQRQIAVGRVRPSTRDPSAPSTA
jgi:hypothetical protein